MASYTFDGPSAICKAVGKHVRCGVANGPVITPTKNLPDGVVGQQLKDGPMPGEALITGTPDVLTELLARKGAAKVWEKFCRQMSADYGETPQQGWIGNESKIAKLLVNFGVDFGDIGLTVYFCVTRSAAGGVAGEAAGVTVPYLWLEIKDNAAAPAGYVPVEDQQPVPMEEVKIRKDEGTPFGVTFVEVRGRIIFATTAAGGLVEKAGIKVGDQLNFINGNPVPVVETAKHGAPSQLPVETARMLKQVEPGEVVLTIQRDRAIVPKAVQAMSLKPVNVDPVVPGGCCAVM